jgi:hypothetical protein
MTRTFSTTVVASKTITAENQFSDWVFIKGKANFRIKATAMSATVFLQRSFTNPGSDGSAAVAEDLTSYTAAVALVIDEPEGAWYRTGCKTGGFVSATALEARISQ